MASCGSAHGAEPRRIVGNDSWRDSDLIVDDVMTGGGEWLDYRAVLSGIELRPVGLFASLAAPLTRWQFERVHRGGAMI